MPYEGRADYVSKQVSEGDNLTLEREPNNPHDSLAVAAYHNSHKIGYIASRYRWVGEAILEGNKIDAMVKDFNFNEQGDLSAVIITIIVSQPGAPSDEEVLSVATLRDELRLLVLVAAADGTFKKVEREIIEKYATLRLEDMKLQLSGDTAKSLVSTARRLPPSDGEIQSLVKFLREWAPDSIDAVWQMSEIIAGIDGKIDEAEFRVVHEIREAIRQTELR